METILTNTEQQQHEGNTISQPLPPQITVTNTTMPATVTNNHAEVQAHLFSNSPATLPQQEPHPSSTGLAPQLNLQRPALDLNNPPYPIQMLATNPSTNQLNTASNIQGQGSPIFQQQAMGATPMMMGVPGMRSPQIMHSNGWPVRMSSPNNMQQPIPMRMPPMPLPPMPLPPMSNNNGRILAINNNSLMPPPPIYNGMMPPMPNNNNNRTSIHNMLPMPNNWNVPPPFLRGRNPNRDEEDSAMEIE